MILPCSAVYCSGGDVSAAPGSCQCWCGLALSALWRVPSTPVPFPIVAACAATLPRCSLACALHVLSLRCGVMMMTSMHTATTRHEVGLDPYDSGTRTRVNLSIGHIPDPERSNTSWPPSFDRARSQPAPRVFARAFAFKVVLALQFHDDGMQLGQCEAQCSGAGYGGHRATVRLPRAA